MNILVINSGSSSLKYQYINPVTGDLIAKGLVERIAIEGSMIKHTAYKNGEEYTKKIVQEIAHHEDAMQLVANLLTDEAIGVVQNPSQIEAIGHRVVHGGEKLVDTVLVNNEVKQAIEDCIPLSPLHNPAGLSGIEVAEKIFPNAKNVVVLDTAFHKTLPAKAYRFAIPEEYYKKYGVRVYGFHGTSHKYVYQAAQQYLQNNHLKAITIHLGNGSSMSAVNAQGECVDTTMGLTPLAGLMMGTRSGDIDPSVIFYLNETAGMKNPEIKNLLNKNSGMLGLTGSSDARDVTEKYNKGDENAILCYEMYAYKIKKYIGAYTAVLNGVDALIFTAGLGEHDEIMRSLACKELNNLGVVLDEEKNIALNHPKEIVEIQAENSAVKILVIPTNEELQIAHEVYDLLNK